MKKTVLLVVSPDDEYMSCVARRAKSKGLVDEVVSSSDTPESFAAAVSGVSSDKNLIIAKGLIETAAFMRLVIGYDDKALIKGGRDGFVSHCFILEKKCALPLPRMFRARPTVLTDAAINISPTAEQKVKIAQNAVDLARNMLGIRYPVLSILTAAGKEHPKIQSSLDGKWIIENGLIHGADVRLDQFDTAISIDARRLKKLGGGLADIMLVPNLDSGNPLYKAQAMRAGYRAAGLVLGCTVPLVLNSRFDSVKSKLLSIRYAKKLFDYPPKNLNENNE